MQTVSYLNKKRYPLLRLLSYMRDNRRDYSLGILYSILNKLFDIFPEILIGVAGDVGVNRHNSILATWFGVKNMLHQLLLLGVLTFFAWTFESLFQYLYSLKWRNLSQVVEHQLRLELYDHIQRATLADVHDATIGQLLGVINDDVNQLERFLEDGLNQIIQIAASTILIGIVFFVCSPLIAFLAIVPVPFILFGAFYFQHKLAPRFLDVRHRAGEIAVALINNLQGLTTIKIFTSEWFEKKRLTKLSKNYQQANEKTIRVSSLVVPVIRMGVLTGFLCTLLIGGYQAIEHSMNVGVFSLLIFLSQRLLWPFSNLAEITVDYQRVMASTTRALNVLTWEPEPDRGRIQINTHQAPKEINFKNLTFAYAQSNRCVFQNLNVSIPAEKTVAFVGESGSGKSSLVRLLCRFYEPSDGGIFYGDNNIAELTKKDWREQIAYVSQEVTLFNGSVKDNIAYAQTQLDQEMIKKAAKMAGADDFIQSLPQGYETMLGESGLNLSGGQRQRIAIARAIMKNAPILILDEATSAVDNETELAIQQAMMMLAKGRTVIVIAHRLSTIRHADVIHVLDKGEIVESGNHEELVKQGNIYSRLWQIQTGDYFVDVPYQ